MHHFEGFEVLFEHCRVIADGEEVREESRGPADQAGGGYFVEGAVHNGADLFGFIIRGPLFGIQFRDRFGDVFAEPGVEDLKGFKVGPFALGLIEEGFRVEEEPLFAGSVRGVGGHRRLFMEAQREVAVDVAHFIRVGGLELDGGQAGAGAVRALEIRVFDQRHHGVFRADRPVFFGDIAEDGQVAFVDELRLSDLAFDRGSAGKVSFPGGPFSVRGKRGAAEKDR